MKNQFIGLLIISLLLAGLVVAVALVQQRSELRSWALQTSATPVNLEILSPSQNERISEVIVVQARANTKQEVDKLKAVLEADDQTRQTLNISSIERGRVSISGTWDARNRVGNHKLQIFLYDTSTKEPTPLGSSTVSVTVTGK